MGVKGKLIGSVEVKCGGHLVHDIFHNYTHHIPNICRGKINHFEIHEGGAIKVGSVVGWKYNDGGNKHFPTSSLFIYMFVITSINFSLLCIFGRTNCF